MARSFARPSSFYTNYSLKVEQVRRTDGRKKKKNERRTRHLFKRMTEVTRRAGLPNIQFNLAHMATLARCLPIVDRQVKSSGAASEKERERQGEREREGERERAPSERA